MFKLNYNQMPVSKEIKSKFTIKYQCLTSFTALDSEFKPAKGTPKFISLPK